jgi:golgi-specific brefeldin A-resistance guanine nucleotide exchange factor 1
MPVLALQHLVHALLSQLPEDPANAIITVKSDSAPPVVANGQKRTTEGPVYDPAIVYVLELCTVLALRDDESMKALGQDVAGALQNILRDASNYHQTMVSRTVFYTLNLLRASYVSILPSSAQQNLIHLGSFLYKSTGHTAYDIEL